MDETGSDETSERAGDRSTALSTPPGSPIGASTPAPKTDSGEESDSNASVTTVIETKEKAPEDMELAHENAAGVDKAGEAVDGGKNENGSPRWRDP